MKTAIFDLDGTLADGKHRLHLLPTVDLHLTDSWNEFNRASKDDPPFQDTIDVCNIMARAGLRVIILTGRSDIVRAETEAWLERNSLSEQNASSSGAKNTKSLKECKRKTKKQPSITEPENTQKTLFDF